MRKLILLPLLLTLVTSAISAQEFSGGFRAGLNFITVDGPQEMNGMETLETFNNTTGFHVGATFALAFTDLFGFKADLMYSQKGYETVFNGPSAFFLYANQDDTEGQIIFGDRNSQYDVVNSYIDIPVTAYYRIGPLELEGGFSAGLLVNSRGTGGIEYTNTPFGPDNSVIFNVDGNFNSDGAGPQGILSTATEALPGTTVFPPSVISAYYNSNRDDRLYRRLDFGLIAGVSFYMNSGLFVGVRYQHGLSDVTRGVNDLRIAAEGLSTERQFNTEDEDRYRSVHASVGFRF